MTTISLAEWQAETFSHLTLAPADRQLAETLNQQRRLEILELRQGLRLRSRSWVGVVKFSHFSVVIEPKLSGGRAGLVQMLELTTGLRALRQYRTDRELQILNQYGLFDLLALLFAQACERVIRRGLRAAYVEQEELIPVVRGRLLAAEQVRRHFGRIDQLACRYDDHLLDHIDNQILTSAVAVCRTRVQDRALQARLQRLYFILAAASSHLRQPPAEVKAELIYNRLNDFYQPAHELAFILLEGMGIEDLLAADRTRSFAFLLNMNSLFEQFVERYLGFVLAGSDIRLESQVVDRTFIRERRSGRGYSIRPDLVARRGPYFAMPLDAKYKAYDDRRVSNADLYQLFLYAQAYARGMSPPAAALIYPSEQRQPQLAEVDFHRHGASLAQLTIWGLPLQPALAEMSANERGPISQKLLAHLDQLGRLITVT